LIWFLEKQGKTKYKDLSCGEVEKTSLITCPTFLIPNVSINGKETLLCQLQNSADGVNS
jgi:hypothetical protein